MDGEHVTLSYRFFNCTRRNVPASRSAREAAINPFTGACYRLALEYLGTEYECRRCENSKAKLVEIASHSGMSGVLRLPGSDVHGSTTSNVFPVKASRHLRQDVTRSLRYG